MPTLLPQNDPNPEQRAKKTAEARRKWQYNYQYLPGLPMVDKLPRADEPELGWWLEVAKVGLTILENGIRLDLAERERLWSRWWNLLTRSNGRYISASVEFWRTVAQLRLEFMQGRLEEFGEALGVGGIRQLLLEVTNLIQAGRTHGRPTSMDDYAKLFQCIDLPEIAGNYQDDKIFARYRLAGPNPILIKSVDALPANFPVTDADYQQTLASDTLAAALAEQRVFLLDYSILNGIDSGTFPDGPKTLPSPLALFAIPPADAADRDLVPIAIQCSQDNAATPVITPDDSAWLLAKTVVQCADANYHEVISHLGYTHLVTEAFAMATRRRLAPNHPLQILLLPHFEGTLSINDLAQRILVAPGGTVDALMAYEIDAARGLAVQVVQNYQFDDWQFPKQVAARGCADTNTLPDYPYRDDGLLLWQAIHDFVSDYIGVYYNDDNDVLNDTELQAWLVEIMSPNGGRMQGIGEDGQVKTRAYLIDVITQVIFTGSCQHAAVNFPQFGMMSYTPAMPLAGYSKVPTGKEASDQQLLDFMPPMDMAQTGLDTLYLLGSVHYTTLGHYKNRTFSDDRIETLVRNFRNRLEQIEAEINQRNENRIPYGYLLPSQIPQSINI